MGSQSVTDFTAAHKKRIQSGILKFDPDAGEASKQAREAGYAAIGSLAPSSSFVKALTSASVDVAAKTLADFVEAIQDSPRSKKATAEVLRRYGVQPTDETPYGQIVARLRRQLNEELSASSKKTEAKPAAEDAIGATILDAIARRYPAKKEPSDASQGEVASAIRRTSVPEFSRIFLRRVISNLLRQTFDAAREQVPRHRIEALAKRVESAVAAKLATRLTRGTKS